MPKTGKPAPIASPALRADVDIAPGPVSLPLEAGGLAGALDALLGRATPPSPPPVVDGRRTGLVLAKVRDRAGATRAGILVRLLQGETLLDQSRTDPRGTVLLRFPERFRIAGRTLAALEAAGDRGADSKPSRQVLFTLGEDGATHKVVEVILDRLPEGALPPGDDPLRRLPLDFTPALFDDAVRLVGSADDPLLGGHPGATAFASRRAPILKRMTVARVGPHGPHGQARRYLVHLRQERVFLGYSLGEVAGMENLVPGHAASQARETVQRTLDRARESVERSASEVQEVAEHTLAQAQKAMQGASSTFSSNSYSSTTVESAVQAESVGMAWNIGVFAGAYSRSSASSRSRAEAMASLNTQASSFAVSDAAMQANEMERSFQAARNEATSRAHDTARQLQSSVQDSVSQVAPLLSRMTNLVRWTVYENYAVCNRVEGVTEVCSHPTFDPRGGGALFSAEDIVEYEPHFLPRLLDPRMAARFAGLRQKVEEARGAAAPVSAIRLAIDYSAPTCTATVAVALGGAATHVQLPRGGSRAHAWLRFNPPLPRHLLESGHLAVQLAAHTVAPGATQPDTLHAAVAAVTLECVTLAGTLLRTVQGFGLELQLVGSQRRATASPTVPAFPVAVGRPEADPLYLHVNRNRNHYMGALLDAACDNPALRDDLPQLAGFRGTHRLWQLPLLGFEGSRVLVLAEPRPDDAFAAELLRSPGAATLVQVASPGTYGEALQGILELADLRGRVPPQLLPPLQVLPPGHALHDPGAARAPDTPPESGPVPAGPALASKALERLPTPGFPTGR